jgi:two-component system cell cycle sensor histidine kinase/response regulator CckA
VEAKKEGEQILGSVTDTGIGLEPEVLEKIFDPFFTLKEVGKGTGLGLSTTHGIVEDHRGVIRVLSRPGAGTTFKIYLPSTQVQKVEKVRRGKGLSLGNGQKVMIVDDEPQSLDILVHMAEHLGYAPIPFNSPLEALKAYREQAPEVVLMDRNMPGMDGVTCIKKIVEMDPGARIIIVSGYEPSGPDGIDETVHRLIKGYIVKPCRMESLSNGIAKALQN